MAKAKVPSWIWYTIVIAVVASWIPLALIARARVDTSPNPPVHIFQGMDIQPKYKPQDVARVFADNRAMRPVVPGTVARGDIINDDHYLRGKLGEEWATTYPSQIEITQPLLQRGQQQFNIYCAPCHGWNGAGQGPIHQRAVALQQPTWVPPTSLVSQTVRDRPHGHIYNSITNGIRNMAGYGTQIEVEDRWAIVAYIRSLQLSRNASVEAVPPEDRDKLR
jgi:mono/diheme cytochrome c family protein